MDGPLSVRYILNNSCLATTMVGHNNSLVLTLIDMLSIFRRCLSWCPCCFRQYRPWYSLFVPLCLIWPSLTGLALTWSLFFSCFMSLLDLHGSLPLLVCPRNSTSISFSISFIQSPCSKRCLKSFLWWPCPGKPTLPLASECYSPNLGHKPSTECPKIWMSSNRLWLCPSKTQFIWHHIRSGAHLCTVHPPVLSIST